MDVLAESQEEIGEALPSQKTFQGKTLFLRGSKSEYISPNDTELIKSHFPTASVEIIDNAGHCLHAENPKQFFEKSLTLIILLLFNKDEYTVLPLRSVIITLPLKLLWLSMLMLIYIKKRKKPKKRY